MESPVLFYLICMIILIVSFCAQIAGIASDSWLVIDMTTPSETYNFGLYYVSYCRDDDSCDTYYITDLPKINPLGIGNDVLDKIFTVYRVGTGLAAASTLVAIIFLSGLTIDCCANCQKCAAYYNHLTSLHCLTLAGGLLAISEAAHYGTEIKARSDYNDSFSVPYSIILTGIGGVLAIVVFFMLVIMSCLVNDRSESVVVERKEVVSERKFVPPKEYYEKAEPYTVVKKDPPTPAPTPTPHPVEILPPRNMADGPPSYSSGRTYSDFLADQPVRNVEYIEMPSSSSKYYESQTTFRNPNQKYHVAQAEPNVYHVTLR